MGTTYLAAQMGDAEEGQEEAPPLFSYRECCKMGKIDTTCLVCTADLTTRLGENRLLL